MYMVPAPTPYNHVVVFEIRRYIQTHIRAYYSKIASCSNVSWLTENEDITHGLRNCVNYAVHSYI